MQVFGDIRPKLGVYNTRKLLVFPSTAMKSQPAYHTWVRIICKILRYLQPHVTLISDPLHPSCCDTRYHIACACQGGLNFVGHYLRNIADKAIFMTYFGLVWPWSFCPLIPKVAPWIPCVNLHHKWFIRFKNTMFTNLITDEQMDKQETREHNASYCQCGLVEA